MAIQRALEVVSSSALIALRQHRSEGEPFSKIRRHNTHQTRGAGFIPCGSQFEVFCSCTLSNQLLNYVCMSLISKPESSRKATSLPSMVGSSRRIWRNHCYNLQRKEAASATVPCGASLQTKRSCRLGAELKKSLANDKIQRVRTMVKAAFVERAIGDDRALEGSTSSASLWPWWCSDDCT